MKGTEMRKLVVGTFMTLDGVMQAPGGPDEDREHGFECGGWMVPMFDDELGARIGQDLAAMGALLIGRKTYDIFAATWPLADADDPFGMKMNGVPKYVASTTLEKAEWNNSTILAGDVATAVAELKRQPGEGEIQVHGSSDLVQTLIRHDLVDEYRLKIFPAVLGSGKRLFGAGTTPRGVRLVESSTTKSGVTMCTYVRGDELTYGEMGPEFDN